MGGCSRSLQGGGGTRLRARGDTLSSWRAPCNVALVVRSSAKLTRGIWLNRAAWRPGEGACAIATRPCIRGLSRGDREPLGAVAAGPGSMSTDTVAAAAARSAWCRRTLGPSLRCVLCDRAGRLAVARALSRGARIAGGGKELRPVRTAAIEGVEIHICLDARQSTRGRVLPHEPRPVRVPLLRLGRNTAHPVRVVGQLALEHVPVERDV